MASSTKNTSDLRNMVDPPPDFNYEQSFCLSAYPIPRH
jgi:hypothetical protein